MTETTTKKETTTKTAAPTKKPVPEYRLRDTFNNFGWTVIVLEGCEWCDKAVKLLEEHKENYAVKKLNHEWFRRLAVDSGITQVPAIYRGNQFFGNYGALEAYYKGSFLKSDEII